MINVNGLKEKPLQKIKIKEKDKNFMLEFKKGSLTIKGLVVFIILSVTKYVVETFFPGSFETIQPMLLNLLDLFNLGSLGAIGLGLRRAMDRIEYNKQG